MHFVKMHGLGNDFVFLDGLHADMTIAPDQVVALCDRRSGIGADGVIIVRSCAEADFWMDYRNSDGSAAEMCGNGLRCLAKYVTDRGYAPGPEFTILTGGGVKTARIDGANSDMHITVNMGTPVLDRAAIPMRGAPSERVVDEPIQVAGRQARITAVQVGNPHAVEFVPDVAAVPLADWGAALEHHEAFPQRVNAAFAQVIDRENVRLRVWERGCGETLACGSGAVATGVAGALNNLTDRCVTVHLALGALRIDWQPSGEVLMTGPATEAYRGTWPD